MPKFLIEATYTAEGMRGLQKDRAEGRLTAIKNTLKSLDGTLEAAYWCLGERDVIVIADLPDIPSASALAMKVSGSGLARTTTTTLLTAEEIDSALEKAVNYRPPGG